jgi:hypothetical protein
MIGNKKKKRRKKKSSKMRTNQEENKETTNTIFIHLPRHLSVGFRRINHHNRL